MKGGYNHESVRGAYGDLGSSNTRLAKLLKVITVNPTSSETIRLIKELGFNDEHDAMSHLIPQLGQQVNMAFIHLDGGISVSNQQLILSYAKRIDCYACEEYQCKIGELWESIVTDKQVATLLLYKKGKPKGMLSKRCLLWLVSYLQGQKIYNDKVDLLHLYYRMFNTNKKDTTYSNYASAAFKPNDKVMLNAIIKNFKKNCGL